MLLTMPMMIILMLAFKIIAGHAVNHGWRSVKSDLIVFTLLSACFGLGLFLTFGNG